MKRFTTILFVSLLIILVSGLINQYLHKEDIVETQIESTKLDRPVWSSDRHWHRVVRRGGTIDPNVITKARRDAKAYLDKRKLSRLKDGGIIDWDWRGPGNVGGRVRAIALQPNGTGGENIFVGAAAGGIWKSTDDGETWSAMDDFAPSLAVTSIVVDPANSNILYAATGEGHIVTTTGVPGAGIFKSVDGGTLWTQLPSTANSEFYWVNKIAINPTNSNHLLAATANYNKNGDFNPSVPGGKVMESLNGGQSWNDILTQSVFDIYTDVEFHPANSNIRAASGYNTLRIYNATNQSYDEKVGSEPGMIDDIDLGRIEVAFSQSNPNVMYALLNTQTSGSEAAIYKSTTAGVSWDEVGTSGQIWNTTFLGNYANTIWVDPCDENHIYFGGVDLWKSEDGGNTFIQISDWSNYNLFVNADSTKNIQLHGDQHIIIPSLNYDCFNKKVFIGNDGGIQKTENISNTVKTGWPLEAFTGWDNLVGTTLGITQFYSINVSPLLTNEFGGGAQDNGILMFDKYDSGTSDPKWKQPLAGDGSVVAFHPTNSDIVYATTNNNRLWVSTDGGIDFGSTSVAYLGPGESPLIGQMVINPLDGDEVFLGGKNLWQFNRLTNQLIKVKDTIPSNDYISTLNFNSSGTEIMVGYENGVVETSDNGGGAFTNWTGDITTPAMPNTCVTDIAQRPDFGGNKEELLITFGGYTQFNIWKYEDDGAGQITASNRSMDFNMQVNSITYHPTASNWVYIGTDVGVFASENEGRDWSLTPLYSGNASPSLNNEGPVFTEVSDLSWKYKIFEEGYSLWAATYGRGLWETENVTGSSGIVLDTLYFDPNNTFGIRHGTRIRPYQYLDQVIFDRIGNSGSVIKFLGGGANPIPGGLVMDKRVVIVNETGTVLFDIQ